MCWDAVPALITTYRIDITVKHSGHYQTLIKFLLENEKQIKVFASDLVALLSFLYLFSLAEMMFAQEQRTECRR